jgi:hypothetical protein
MMMNGMEDNDSHLLRKRLVRVWQTQILSLWALKYTPSRGAPFKIHILDPSTPPHWLGPLSILCMGAFGVV